MRNILVTGGAGFIGSSFVAQEVKFGNNVIVLDALTYAARREYLEYINEENWKGRYKLVVGNICDYDLVLKLLRENDIEWVVHFAAETHVDRSIDDSTVFIETNVLGTQRMLMASLDYYKELEESKKKKFRFHHISTDEVFGHLPLNSNEKFNENTRYHPNNPYSATKAASDHLVRAWYHTYGLPVTISNCTNNYGPRQFYEKLIPLMIKFGIEGKPMTIHGTGNNVRDWIHVDDHNHGVRLILEKGKVGETYYLGGNSERSNKDVVYRIAEILDVLKPREDGKSYTEQISYVKDRPGNDLRYAMDCSKIENELGFKRKYESFEYGLRETVQWYLNNLNYFK
jgi:dTDP-glucose 4,6-dehydratase